MIVRPSCVYTLPVIDIRHNGMGDVVVACWLIHSARRAGIHLLLNPRQQHDVAALLSIPADALTTAEAPDWSTTAGLGHQYEYGEAPHRQLSRFDAWGDSLHLPRLTRVRPPYHELDEDAAWAEAQWNAVTDDPSAPRILVFPDSAWSIRAWPKAYFVDLVTALRGWNAAVAAMSATSAFIASLPCRWWAGFSVRQIAAMARRASVVVANDSGPAHLAAAVGTPTIAICGPTDPGIVFDHEPNVRPAILGRAVLPCVPCHFSAARGFRAACDLGGCQALMRLDPGSVANLVADALLAPAPKNGAARA